MASRHSAAPESFDWRKVDVRFRALEEEIGRRQFLDTDSAADELRSDNKVTNILGEPPERALIHRKKFQHVRHGGPSLITGIGVALERRYGGGGGS